MNRYLHLYISVGIGIGIVLVVWVLVLVLYWWCGWYNNVSDWINDRGSCSCLAAKTPHSQPVLTSSSPILKYIQNLEKQLIQIARPHTVNQHWHHHRQFHWFHHQISLSAIRFQFRIFMMFQDYQSCEKNMSTTNKHFWKHQSLLWPRGCYWWWCWRFWRQWWCSWGEALLTRSLLCPRGPWAPQKL